MSRIYHLAWDCRERDANLSSLAHCMHREKIELQPTACFTPDLFTVWIWLQAHARFRGELYSASLNHMNCWKLAQVWPQTETREKASFQKICCQMVILSRRKRRKCEILLCFEEWFHECSFMHSNVTGCSFHSSVKKWMCVIYQCVCSLKLMEKTNLKPCTLKFFYTASPVILFLCTNPVTTAAHLAGPAVHFGFFRFFFLLVLSAGITDRSVIAWLLSPPDFEDSQCLCPLPACCISPVPHKFTNGSDNQLHEDPRIKFLGDSWLGNIPLPSWFWPHSELSCPCCWVIVQALDEERAKAGVVCSPGIFPLQLLILLPAPCKAVSTEGLNLLQRKISNVQILISQIL